MGLSGRRYGDIVRVTGTVALLAAVVSCGAAPAGDTDASSGPKPTSVTTPPAAGIGDDPSLQEYRRLCEQAGSDEEWRAGQIDYPGHVSLGMGESKTYQAAVDTRSVPLPPGQVIDSASPKSKPVLVRCILSARLDSVDDGLEVSAENEGLGGWHSQAFSASGVIEWIWTVRAAEPGDHELRLTVRPITTEQDLMNNLPVEQKSFTTDVEVDASFVQEAAHWIDTQFTAVNALLVSIGGVVLGVLGFITNTNDYLRNLRKRPSRKRRKNDSEPSSTGLDPSLPRSQSRR